MAPRTADSTGTDLLEWGVVVSVLFSLVVVPAVVLAETTLGVLSAVGVCAVGFAAIVMAPGLALGALSLVVMLGCS